MSGVQTGHRLKSLLNTDANASRASGFNSKDDEESSGSRQVHCGVFLRVSMEEAFANYGEYVARNTVCRRISMIFLLLLTGALGAGLSTAFVETRIPKLWVESGGRLDAEADYYNKFNNRGDPAKSDPTCLSCLEGPASGGEKLSTCENTSIAAASMSVTDMVKPFDPPDVSLSEETSTGGGSAEIFIITPENAGADVISKENLEATVKVHEHISGMKLCLDRNTGERLSCESDCAGDDGGDSRGKDCTYFSWDGLDSDGEIWGIPMCSKITPPRGLEVFSSLVPCNRITVLDCFSEGDFDWSTTLKNIIPYLPILSPSTSRVLEEDYGIVGYGDLPSITSSSDEQLHHAVTGGCAGFARKVPLMRWYNSLIIGNPVVGQSRDVVYPKTNKVPIEKKGFTERADAFQSIFLLASVKTLADRAQISNDVALAALTAWRDELQKLSLDQDLAADSNERLFPSVKMSVLTSTAMSAAIGAVTNSNLYFSAIGIGIMAAFVVLSLVHYPCKFFENRSGSNYRKSKVESSCACGSAPLGIAGLLIVVLATVSAFGFSCLIGISFNATSLQVLPFLALGLGVDDMFVLIHCYETFSHGVRGDRNVVIQSIGKTMSHAGPSVTMTSMANFAAFLIGSTIPLPAVTSFCYMAASIVFFNYMFLVIGLTPIMTIWRIESDAGKLSENFKRSSHIQLDDSSEQSEVTFSSSKTEPDDSIELDLEKQRRDTLSGKNLRESRLFRYQCIDSYARVLLTPWIKLAVCIVSCAFLGTSIYFTTTVEDGLDISDIAPRESALSRFLNDKTIFFSSFDVQIVLEQIDYPCRQKEIHTFLEDLRENDWVSYVSESNWFDLYVKFARRNSTSNLTTVFDEGKEYVRPSQFYAGLAEWDADIGSALDVLSSQISTFGYAEVDMAGDFSWQEKGRLTLSKVAFTVDGLNSTKAYADMIKSVRGVCERASKNGVKAFPRGVPFLYWEQYVGLRNNFWRGLGLVFGAILIMIVPFVVNPVAALIVALIILCTVIEIFGMLGAASIKFSAIPAVSLIMSIGISVEFVAHLTLAFHMEISGSRNERVRTTLHRMLVPVLQGGLSTFFAIILLGFSEYDFVRRYFFFIFLMVCVIGLFNGLVLLPVILSLIGPTALECCPNLSEKNEPLTDKSPIVTRAEEHDLDDAYSHVHKSLEMADYPNGNMLTLDSRVETPLGTGAVKTLARASDGMIEILLDWQLARGEHAILYTQAHRLRVIADQAKEVGTESAAVLPPPKHKKKRRKRKSQNP